VERFSIYKGSSSNQRHFLWRGAPKERKVLLYTVIKRKLLVGEWWVTTAFMWIKPPPTQKTFFELLLG
jgi:hypothetical protein